MDGEALGYGIVSWFLLTDVALETLGADRPIEAIIAHATQHAAAHDSRDCIGFNCQDWCHLFDFATEDDELGWTVFSGGVFNNNAWRSVHNGGDTKLAIQIAIPNTDVKSVRVKYTTAAVSGGQPRRVRYASVTDYGNLDTGAGNFDTVIFNEQSITANLRVQIQSQGVAGENTITEIEVCGTGSNPF